VLVLVLVLVRRARARARDLDVPLTRARARARSTITNTNTITGHGPQDSEVVVKPRGMKNLVIVVAAAIAVAACTKKTDEPPPSDFKPTEAPPLPPGPDKLEKEDVVVGTGPEAKTGDTVRMHYRGTLMNGKEFDKNEEKDKPFEFVLGKGNVIKGWDEGVPGMKVGGKRKLTIPWSLAYGDKGSGDKIPPKAALKFDVDLVEVVGQGEDAGAAKDAGKK
jgi:FKBP-type peptidyl-prolyl cis-trans isomerase